MAEETTTETTSTTEEESTWDKIKDFLGDALENFGTSFETLLIKGSTYGVDWFQDFMDDKVYDEDSEVTQEVVADFRIGTVIASVGNLSDTDAVTAMSGAYAKMSDTAKANFLTEIGATIE